MLVPGFLAVILTWPAPEPGAVRLATELGAETLLIRQPLGPAPEHPAALSVVAEVPLDGVAVEEARKRGYDGAAVAAQGTEAEFRTWLAAQRGFVRFAYLKADQLSWDVRPAQAVFRGGQWPGLRAAGGGEAGATERPWISSNLHLFAYLRGRFPERAAVLFPEPDEKAVRYEGAEVAIAEACAWGGTALLELPEMYRTGLTQMDPRALSAWSRLREVAAFARTQAPLPPSGQGGRTAIVTGPLDEENEEFLNLAFRGNLSPRVLAAGSVQVPEGLRIVAAPNLTLSGEDARALAAFARGGGIVLTAPPAGAQPSPWWGEGRKLRTEGGRDVFQLGKGLVYAYPEAFLDPSQFASDLREASGLDNPTGRGLHGLDLRVWNAGSVLGMVHRGKDSQTVVLISYGRWMDGDFLAGARGKFASATEAEPGKGPRPVRLMRWDGRVEWNQEGLNRIAVITLRELGP